MSDPESVTVAAWLEQAVSKPGAPALRREAQWLLEHVLAASRAALHADPSRRIAPEALTRLNRLWAARCSGTPLAYLIGRQPFWTFELAVSPAVLIPRADTETLVLAALEAGPPDRALRVLDLGTGSGAVAIALALERPSWQITAVDVSEPALQVARSNAAALDVAIEFLRSDWFSALRGRQFDLVVGNPPYVAEGDPHLEDPGLASEPAAALLGGPDGLKAIRRIAATVGPHLTAGGGLWLEHGWDQGTPVCAILAAAGIDPLTTRRDAGGNERVSGGHKRS